MATSKRGPGKRPGAAARTKAPAAGRKIHLHIENASDMGRVFEADRKRVREALARSPGLAGKLRITIGYYGDIIDKALATADVLFGWRFKREDLARRAPNLRWVAAHGAGVSHLMPLDWLPKGAVLTNSRGVHGGRASEYLIMALLMLNNRIPEMVANQRKARWQQCYNTAIGGKTLLIVGVGHIGGGAAAWAKRFGLHVIGIRRSGRAHRSVDEMHRPGDLPGLLPRADFVLVTAPHTVDTHHMIGRRELGLMKKGAGLIVYSRAQVVDYEALRRKLEKGAMTAILDVFEPEPLPRSSALWKVPNLVITPHCSSDDWENYTPDTLDLVFANMWRFIEGRPLTNRVSPRYQY